MAKFLEQQLVTEYAQLCADIKKMDERKAKLREEIVAGFNDGLRCPRRGPYLIVMTSQARRTISWKDEFVKLAKETLGKAWKKTQLRIENDAPVVNTPMLLPQVNPDYEVEEQRPVVVKRGA